MSDEEGDFMLQKWLEDQYGIQVEEELILGNYHACKRGNDLYFLIHPLYVDKEELAELQTIALHLSSKGDLHIPLFLPAKNGELINKWDTGQACILVRKQLEPYNQKKIGRKLAKFHGRGRTLTYPVKKISRIGQWKQLWEKRLDQMEKVWNGKLFQAPENEFEKMFLESFPYYMGLAENAIGYLVDTELDDTPGSIDHGTVCHDRFTSTTWGEKMIMKNPFEWILDHGSRDVAEWTRERYFLNTQTYQPDLRTFFYDYQSINKFSSFSWRLLYARMLFPLHYFECIEEYYITQSEQRKNLLEEQLFKVLQQSGEYETFLGGFYQLLEVPVQSLKIPEIEWLKKS